MSIKTKRAEKKGIVKFDIFLWYPEIFLYAKDGMKQTLISKDVFFFFNTFFHTLSAGTSRINEDYVYEGR